MRIFRGLENIHSVIDRHEAEWRKEQGEEPKHDTISLEEAVRRRLTAPYDEGSGRFSADRFLGGKSEPVTPKPKLAVETETETETVPVHEPETDTEPEAIEIIKSKDGRHSWLYNEVMKAISDASKDSKNTKIIAVFIPVVQNGKELESLPADETVTVQPIDIENTKVEAVDEEVAADETEPVIAAEIETALEAEPEITPVPADVAETETETELAPEPEAETQPEVTEDEFHLIPEINVESDKGLTEAFREIEEKLDESIQEAHEQEEQQELQTETEEFTEEPVPEMPESEPVISEETAEPSQEEPLIPEPEPEPETAMPLIEAEPVPEQPADIPEATEIPEVTDENEDNYENNEEIAKGEPLAFEEINNSDESDTVQQDIQNETDKEVGEVEVEEISLPEPLDDDDVFDEGIFDESLTEVYRPDDDNDDSEDGTVIIEGNAGNETDGEIEVIPDPDKKTH